MNNNNEKKIVTVVERRRNRKKSNTRGGSRSRSRSRGKSPKPILKIVRSRDPKGRTRLFEKFPQKSRISEVSRTPLPNSRDRVRLGTRDEIKSQSGGFSGLSAGGKVAAQICKALSLPESGVCRLGDDFSAVPTAVAKPHSDDPVVWVPSAQSSTMASELPVTDNFCAIFRDAVRAAVVSKQQNIALALDQNYQFFLFEEDDPTLSSPASTFTVGSDSPGLVPALQGPLWLNIAYLQDGSDGAGGTWAPHGPYLFPGVDKAGLKYVWLDGAVGCENTLLFNLETDASATDEAWLSLQLYKYEDGEATPTEYIKSFDFGSLMDKKKVISKSPSRHTAPNLLKMESDVVKVDSNNNSTTIKSVVVKRPKKVKRVLKPGDGTAGSFVIQNIESGYYAFKVTMGGALLEAAVTIGPVLWTSNSSSMAHLTLPHYIENARCAQITRVLAASVMYKNTSDGLGGAGSLVGVQFPPKSDWTDIYTLRFDGLAQMNNAVPLPAKNGMFGFMRPTSLEDLEEWKKPINFKPGGMLPIGSCFDLTPSGGFTVVYATIPFNEVYGGVNSQVGRWILNYGIEYQTTDTWRDTIAANYPREAYETAGKLLKTVPQFTENPSHLKDIWNAIKSGGRAVEKYAPMAISLAQKLASL